MDISEKIWQEVLQLCGKFSSIFREIEYIGKNIPNFSRKYVAGIQSSQENIINDVKLLHKSKLSKTYVVEAEAQVAQLQNWLLDYLEQLPSDSISTLALQNLSLPILLLFTNNNPETNKRIGDYIVSLNETTDKRMAVLVTEESSDGKNNFLSVYKEGVDSVSKTLYKNLDFLKNSIYYAILLDIYKDNNDIKFLEKNYPLSEALIKLFIGVPGSVKAFSYIAENNLISEKSKSKYIEESNKINYASAASLNTIITFFSQKGILSDSVIDLLIGSDYVYVHNFMYTIGDLVNNEKNIISILENKRKVVQKFSSNEISNDQMEEFVKLFKGLNFKNESNIRFFILRNTVDTINSFLSEIEKSSNLIVDFSDYEQELLFNYPKSIGSILKGVLILKDSPYKMREYDMEKMINRDAEKFYLYADAFVNILKLKDNVLLSRFENLAENFPGATKALVDIMISMKNIKEMNEEDISRLNEDASNLLLNIQKEFERQISVNSYYDNKGDGAPYKNNYYYEPLEKFSKLVIYFLENKLPLREDVLNNLGAISRIGNRERSSSDVVNDIDGLYKFLLSKTPDNIPFAQNYLNVLLGFAERTYGNDFTRNILSILKSMDKAGLFSERNLFLLLENIIRENDDFENPFPLKLNFLDDVSFSLKNILEFKNLKQEMFDFLVQLPLSAVKARLFSMKVFLLSDQNGVGESNNFSRVAGDISEIINDPEIVDQKVLQKKIIYEIFETKRSENKNTSLAVGVTSQEVIDSTIDVLDSLFEAGLLNKKNITIPVTSIPEEYASLFDARKESKNHQDVTLLQLMEVAPYILSAIKKLEEGGCLIEQYYEHILKCPLIYVESVASVSAMVFSLPENFPKETLMNYVLNNVDNISIIEKGLARLRELKVDPVILSVYVAFCGKDSTSADAVAKFLPNYTESAVFEDGSIMMVGSALNIDNNWFMDELNKLTQDNYLSSFAYNVLGKISSGDFYGISEEMLDQGKAFSDKETTIEMYLAAIDAEQKYWSFTAENELTHFLLTQSEQAKFGLADPLSKEEEIMLNNLLQNGENSLAKATARFYSQNNQGENIPKEASVTVSYDKNNLSMYNKAMQEKNIVSEKLEKPDSNEGENTNTTRYGGPS